jgi:hypothetical protein
VTLNGDFTKKQTNKKKEKETTEVVAVHPRTWLGLPKEGSI